MKNYGEKLQKQGIDISSRAVALAQELKNDIATSKKYNGIFQTQFIQKFHREDKTFSAPRDHGFKVIDRNYDCTSHLQYKEPLIPKQDLG